MYMKQIPKGRARKRLLLTLPKVSQRSEKLGVTRSGKSYKKNNQQGLEMTQTAPPGCLPHVSTLGPGPRGVRCAIKSLGVEKRAARSLEALERGHVCHMRTPGHVFGDGAGIRH